MANNGMKKAMAAWCEVCPFCVVGRWFPKSIYSRLLGRWSALALSARRIARSNRRRNPRVVNLADEALDKLREMRRALRQTLIALKTPDEQIDRLALRGA